MQLLTTVIAYSIYMNKRTIFQKYFHTSTDSKEEHTPIFSFKIVITKIIQYFKSMLMLTCLKEKRKK